MDTILLATPRDNIQASMLRDVLSNEGIESFTKNEILSSVFANISGFEIEIYVFEKDFDKAREILMEGFPELVEE